MTTHNRFVKIDGGFERPKVLTPEQANLYFSTEGKKANPLSPLAWLSAQSSGVPAPRVLFGETSNTPNSPLPQTPAPNVSMTTASGPSPYDSFNLILGDMLKKAQGFNTADLLKRKRELERESLARNVAPTEESLRTLSPAQQSSIRSGNVSAVSPEIDDAAYQVEKAEQNITNFFKIYGEAKKLGAEWADKMVAPDSIIENARKVIETRPESMSTVLAGFNDKTKEKILGSLDYSKLSPKADIKPLQFVSGTDNQSSGVFDPNTGKFTGGTGGGGPGGGKGKLVTIDGVSYMQDANGKLTRPEVPTAPANLQNSIDQLVFLQNTAKKAIELSPASGASGISRKAGEYFIGDTKFNQLVSQTNTLRTNLLTLMTDPSIKKFFGPQMSNADVQLMTSAGTTLNPEIQSPELLKAEVMRLQSLFTRMQTALEGGVNAGTLRVRINSTGQTGTVDTDDFDPSTMTKI